MFLFPNGQNIQFMPVQKPRPAPPPEPEAVDTLTNQPETSTAARGGNTTLAALKDIAPGLNRRARRAKLAELRTKAKNETAELARKEIKKQQKEKARG